MRSWTRGWDDDRVADAQVLLRSPPFAVAPPLAKGGQGGVGTHSSVRGGRGFRACSSLCAATGARLGEPAAGGGALAVGFGRERPQALRPRQPDRLVHRAVRQQEARPEERAAMLERLGFKHFAYDWRAEHIPTFDAEVRGAQAARRRARCLLGAPGELNRESRIILDLLKRHGIKAQLWVLLDLGADRVTGAEQERRIAAAMAKLAAAGRRGRQDRLLAGALQPRRLVRRAGKPDRDHRAAQGGRASPTSAWSTTCTTATTISTASPPCCPR